jgi:hypothetical protein
VYLFRLILLRFRLSLINFDQSLKPFAMFRFLIYIPRSERRSSAQLNEVFFQARRLYSPESFDVSEASGEDVVEVLGRYPVGLAKFIQRATGANVRLEILRGGQYVPEDIETFHAQERIESFAVINIGLLNNPFLTPNRALLREYELASFHLAAHVRANFPEVTVLGETVEGGQYQGQSEPTCVLSLFGLPSVIREVVRDLLTTCTQECIPYFIPEIGEAVLEYPAETVLDRLQFDARYFFNWDH